MWFRRLSCSFCRRSNKDVAKLVAGARGYICDRCAHEAVRIMESTTTGEAGSGAQTNVAARPTSEWNRTWHFATAND